MESNGSGASSASRGRPWPADPGTARRLPRHPRGDGSRGRLALTLSLSAALHAAAFLALPPLPLAPRAPVVRPLRTIGLPSPEARAPAVRLPEPSPEIVRPGPPAPAPPEAEPWSPPFLPHDLAPRLVNAEEVRARLHAAYPADLREAGVGGEALLWLLVGERGEPREVRLARSSGATALDSVAREVSAGMRFRPAFAGSRAVAVWIAQPIRFSVERDPREAAPPGR